MSNYVDYLSSLSYQELLAMDGVASQEDSAKIAHALVNPVPRQQVSTGIYPHGLTYSEAEMLNKAAAVDFAGRQKARHMTKKASFLEEAQIHQTGMLESKPIQGVSGGLGGALLGGLGGAGLGEHLGGRRGALIGGTAGALLGGAGGAAVGLSHPGETAQRAAHRRAGCRCRRHWGSLGVDRGAGARRTGSRAGPRHS